MTLASLAAVLLLAAPAVAQDRAAEIDFENALRDNTLAESARKHAKIENAITDMNDGVGAGERVVEYLRSNAIKVSLKTQAEASKTVVENGVASITLSDALPAYSRVYGTLIAKEIAALMYADMPACAERSYMRRATAGRVWTELGGHPSHLPVVEPLIGAKVAAISDEITPWLDKDGVQWALQRIGISDKLPSLPALHGTAKDDAARATIAAAETRFLAFFDDEKIARAAVGLR